MTFFPVIPCSFAVALPRDAPEAFIPVLVSRTVTRWLIIIGFFLFCICTLSVLISLGFHLTAVISDFTSPSITKFSLSSAPNLLPQLHILPNLNLPTSHFHPCCGVAHQKSRALFPRQRDRFDP